MITTDAFFATAVYATDLDGDGDIDVLSAAGSQIAWYENDSVHRSALFDSPDTISTQAVGVAAVGVGDLDGDGDLDAVAASAGDNTLAWYSNLGGGNFLPEETVATDLDDAAAIHTADLDHDGDLDLLAASRDNNTLAWYENAGAGSFLGAQVISSAAEEPLDVAAADLDGDGNVDVFAASYGDDTVAWFAGDGLGGFGAAQPITTLADGATAVDAADLDRDGDLDALTASADDHTVAWYANDGAGVFGGIQVISDTAMGASDVSAADLDRDGDLDVLVASAADHTIAWYENDGAGGFGPRQLLSTTASEAAAVVAADFDRDEDLDVLSAAPGADTVAWHENRGGQFALITTSTAHPAIIEGRADDVLQIDAVHRGREGDHDAQLVWFELLLEQAPGEPLSSAQANALFENLAVYRDDGSGEFNAGADSLVTTLETLVLSNGQMRIEFTDADANVAVAFAAPATFFVVVQLTADAAQQATAQFLVTHLTETSSLVEDLTAHIPLDLEFSANVSSAVVQAAVLGDMDRDGDVDLDLDDVEGFVTLIIGGTSGGGSAANSTTRDSASSSQADMSLTSEHGERTRTESSADSYAGIRLGQTTVEPPSDRADPLVSATTDEILTPMPVAPRERALLNRSETASFPGRFVDRVVPQDENQASQELHDAVWSNNVDWLKPNRVAP